MAITRYKPEGIQTLDVKWNGGILRVTQNATLRLQSRKDELILLVDERTTDDVFALATIELNANIRNLRGSQKEMLEDLLDRYDYGVDIFKTNQLEEAFRVITTKLRSVNLID